MAAARHRLPFVARRSTGGAENGGFNQSATGSTVAEINSGLFRIPGSSARYKAETPTE